MSRSEEAWEDVGDQFQKLGSMFRAHFESQESEEATDFMSDDEVTEAVHSFGESIKTAFGAVADAVTDPDVQTEARQTAGSLFEALGTTFSELGAEIAKKRERGDSE